MLLRASRLIETGRFLNETVARGSICPSKVLPLDSWRLLSSDRLSDVGDGELYIGWKEEEMELRGGDVESPKGLGPIGLLLVRGAWMVSMLCDIVQPDRQSPNRQDGSPNRPQYEICAGLEVWNAGKWTGVTGALMIRNRRRR